MSELSSTVASDAAATDKSAHPDLGPEGPPVEAGPLVRHQYLRAKFERERDEHDATVGRFSIVQLVLFLASAVAGGTGLSQGNTYWMIGGAGTFGLFLIVRMLQSRAINRRDRAATRMQIHDRHVLRLTDRWMELPVPPSGFAPDHPYASDLDISGPGSLAQRIDTAHTRAGIRTLAAWLGSPADPDALKARQQAVQELARRVELRQELEAAVLDTGRDHLNPDPFVELMQQEGLIAQKPWLKIAAFVLPVITVGLLVAGQIVGGNLAWAFVLPLVGQFALVRMTEPHAAALYKSMGEKRGFVEAFVQLFRVAETTEFESPLLQELQERLKVDGVFPSRQLARLERWVNFYELRENGLAHLGLNPLFLWDLNCLIRIESWIDRVGRKSSAWFEVLGELEALASLSVLLHQDMRARMPEIVDAKEGLACEALAHPLLPGGSRVSNDVTLGGPRACLIVTGSNMAGKSTLLRSVGVNLALALAGGPVIADVARIPRVRLRASMRINDSLQSGASYFQAELITLREVVAGADEAPPILFLLDELLRGTNARARHIGARAVVRHLLDRGAMGMVATHDIALSELESEHPGEVSNVHFTDVIQDGEMVFDYRLRPGVVKTSNALRLLKQVGIEVDESAVALPPAGE